MFLLLEEAILFRLPSTNDQLVINKLATLSIGSGVMLNIDTQNRSALNFADRSSILHLNGGYLHTADQGLELLKGQLVVEGKCKISSDGVDQSTALTIGDGLDESNDLPITLLHGGQLEHQLGVLDYRNIDL